MCQQAIGETRVPTLAGALGFTFAGGDTGTFCDMEQDGQWADGRHSTKFDVFTYDRNKTGPTFFLDLVIENYYHNVMHTDFPKYNMTDTGLEADIFVKAADNSTLVGECRDVDIMSGIERGRWRGVDALWIDMNEPSNFVKGSTKGCNQNSLNYPPYLPHLDGVEEKGELFVKTLCMDSQQTLGRHYDVHSLYAHTMAIRTYKSLEQIFPGKRPWTMTRSSYVGTGHYATKWQGDNQAQWSNMHYSIISLMEFGLFGFPMNGADICGFWLEPSYEMCVRWHQLGAFYPFARNHNGKGDDPVVFKHQDPASFPQDDTTLSIDKQFMLGPAFLISPVLEDRLREVKAYFPQGRWFDYTTGERIHSEGQHVILPTPLEKFNLHIRGGHIVPWQTPAVTTEDSRTNDLGLLVALGPDNTASGELFWDDGLSTVNATNYDLIKFSVVKTGELTIQPLVKSFTVNGVPVLAESSIHYNNDIIYLRDIPNLNLTANGAVTWSVE
ncbi:hypothetical protein Btru_023695 [Bulinus truncatus]|nr:hypothetical protein Btru_023695 [Bulinus truncatus]